MRATRPVALNAGVVSGVVLLGISAVALWGARQEPLNVWLFPRVCAAVVALCGILLVEEGWRRPERVVIWSAGGQGQEIAAFAGAGVAYAALLPWLGFWCATGLFLGLATYGLAGRRGLGSLLQRLAVGWVVALALDALFVGVFSVPLPGGALWGGAPWRPWLP